MSFDKDVELICEAYLKEVASVLGGEAADTNLTRGPNTNIPTHPPKFKKDDNNCPVCKEPYVSQCRCIGPHSLEGLKKGHGKQCKNGHRWCGDNVYTPRQ